MFSVVKKSFTDFTSHVVYSKHLPTRSPNSYSVLLTHHNKYVELCITSVLIYCTWWQCQPELINEVFMDEGDGEGSGPRPSLLSDRCEYRSLAAVPRLSRPSVEPKVPLSPAEPLWHCGCPSAWVVVVRVYESLSNLKLDCFAACFSVKYGNVINQCSVWIKAVIVGEKEASGEQ